MRWHTSRRMKVMSAALLIVTALLVLFPTGYVRAGGMVANPGFELGEDEVPWGWVLSGNATRADTGPIHGGSWTARITAPDDVLTQWIENITPLVTYEAWGWIYVSGDVRGEIQLDFWEQKEGRQLGSTKMMSTEDTGELYAQTTTTIQAPVGATHVRIRLLATGWNGGAEVRFDEIGFYPLRAFCFIATAAYGTETASELDILRDFRDQVLLDNALGSRFVRTYYRVSPAVAEFIARSDLLRAIVREALINPVVHVLQWSQELWIAPPDSP